MAARYINDDIMSKWEQAGIDMRTGKPTRAIDKDCSIKEDIKRQLRIIDEQDAVNRYTWYNLPCDVSSQELERMLYYKGQLCFFYFKDIDKFYFMPYALDGSIDFYGRYESIKPVPFADGTTDYEKAQVKNQAMLLSTLKLKVLYDIPLEEIDPFESCVLLHDYTKQLSQKTVSRQIIQDSLLDVMSDCIPFTRTALLNSTGVQGMQVTNADEYANVEAASRGINKAALDGKKWIPISAQLKLQELTGGTVAKGEEFMMAMQSLDNFRLSTYGLANGGLFEKQTYQNNAQTALNGNGQIGNPLQDGLSIRQRFCDIVNSVWGLGISCEISETASQMDLNMDGNLFDDKDQSGVPGDQQQEVEYD